MLFLLYNNFKIFSLIFDYMKKFKRCVLYEKLENKKVRCFACRHRCVINENHTGICGVRANFSGDLYLIVHSKPSAYHIDPIEKKPFYHFLPSEQALSLGTVGCNFRCAWCQNHDLSQGIKEYSMFNAEKAVKFLEHNSFEGLEPERIVEDAINFGVKIIAYTYNEPTIWMEYAIDIAKLAKKEGIKNVFVSSGYESEEGLKFISRYIDAFNIDLKAFRDETYRKYIGATLDGVLKTIKEIKKKGKWLEITTLLIPDINDSIEEIEEIADFICSIDKDIPWHISRFFPHYKITNKPPTPISKLVKAREIGIEHGLRHVYLGNIIDKKYESTYCPECKNIVIEREGYFVKNYLDENGKCPYCGYKIKGVWK